LLLVLVILFRLLEIWKYGAMEEDEFHAEEIVVVVDRREEGRRCEHFWWRRRIARILFRQPGRHSSSRPQISNGQISSYKVVAGGRFTIAKDTYHTTSSIGF
jgi:hypothetical protein